MFSQNFQSALSESKLSAYRVAKLLGVHPTTVHNWLYGRSQPTAEFIPELVKILHTSYERLLEG